MPVRSSSSSVLRWPDRARVEAALRRWAKVVARARLDVTRIGCFGSFVRDDWGVGSDLDLVAVVASSDQPFERRASSWSTLELPVPVDLLVYTAEEWERVAPRQPLGEVVWLFDRRDPVRGS